MSSLAANLLHREISSRSERKKRSSASDSRSRSRSNDKSPSRKKNSDQNPSQKNFSKNLLNQGNHDSLIRKEKGDEIQFQITKSKELSKVNVAEPSEEEFELEETDESEKSAINNQGVRKSKTIALKTATTKIQDPRRKLFEKFGTKEKLNLIVDLDETLLNSAGVSWTFDESTLKHIPKEFIREIQNEGDGMRVIVVLRPYYKQFLERLARYYNIYAYSHGRWDYVEKVLNIIDEDKLYINRDTIFKNLGQVGKSTTKNISGLGLVNKEADKTVILDDQKYIWEVASKKVLPSKKFIPLKEYMHEEKYLRYMLIERRSENGIWQLNHKEDPFGLKLYAEWSMVDRTSSQLEYLANFLEEIYVDYNLHNLSYPAGHEKLKVNKIIEDKIGRIIKAWKVAIIGSSEQRTKMFQELAQTLGADIVELEDAHHIIVDADLNRQQKHEVQDQLDNKPLLSIISADWLIECFFSVTRVSLENFRREEFET